MLASMNIQNTRTRNSLLLDPASPKNAKVDSENLKTTVPVSEDFIQNDQSNNKKTNSLQSFNFAQKSIQNSLTLSNSSKTNPEISHKAQIYSGF